MSGQSQLDHTWMGQPRRIAPLTGEARRRLRRARPLVTVAQLLGPTLLVVLVWIDFARRRDWNPVVVPTVMWPICVWRWRRGRYRPHGWPRTALWMSIYGGLLSASVLELLGDVGSGWYLVVMTTTAACVVGLWALARLARSMVLVPFTTELADSPLELAFPSRADPRKVLQIRQHELLVGGSPVALLDEVGPVESLDSESGVRFEALGDTVVFPTGHGKEIAAVIQRRRPVPAPPQPPRRTPSPEEFRTVDGKELMRRRLEVSRRIDDAVRELADLPSDRLPAARAELRDLCDQAITELIHGADLLVPHGRVMLRRAAARIQRLRDHHCGPS